MSTVSPHRHHHGTTVLVFTCILSVLWSSQTLSAQEGAVRAKAVLHLSFDEAEGAALDSALAGTVKDAGQLVNGAARVKSPFAGQQGKSAILIEGGKKQFVQVPDSVDLDQAKGVSISCFYLHLGSAEDAGFQGLFAKRTEGNGNTNYGINFGAKQDLLQVYLNDGTGFKLAHFGVQQALGIRRPGFITAIYEIGDAPGDDADQDADDILVRLYLNGQPLVPKQYAGNINVGNDTWILNVNAAGLLNDVPFTVGSSTPTIEFASGVFDEISIFPGALTAAEVQKLFLESAGPNATSAVLTETLPAQVPAPTISSLSTYGVQLGTTSRLVITGTNLQSPAVKLGVPGATVTLGANSNASQIELQVQIPPTTAVQHYSVRVQTPGGLSNALPLAVDGLTQLPIMTQVPEKLVALPFAVSGTISGAQLIKTYFQGKAGQHIIADVEAKRIGATLTPVLEIKTATGTPLKIEWGKPEFRGDARVETTIPADGMYYVELHDLSYAAPGVNPFRLKLGDLKLADSVLGGVTLGTETQVGLSGPGLDLGLRLSASATEAPIALPTQLPLPANLGISAPAPFLLVSPGAVAVEAPVAGQPQVVDARMLPSSQGPVTFFGVLGQRKERDVVVLQVVPGQKLNFQVSAIAVDSPLDPQLQILKHPEGNVLAAGENPGAREVALDFTVPADQSQIQLAIRDLRARGGASFRYRLRIMPAGQPDFSLTVAADRIQLPIDGAAVTQIDVNRAGYNGVVKLSLIGDSQLSLSPTEIPAGINQAWVTLMRSGQATSAESLLGVRIVGEAAELAPPLRRVASIAPDARHTLLSEARTLLGVGVTPAIGATLELGTLPAAIYRGVDFTVPLQFKGTAAAKAKTARLTLMSTEVPRLVNPAAPNQGQKPLVDGGVNQTIEMSETTGGLKISVPTDLADGTIDFVIKAELVEHPFAQNVVATTYSKPFRLPVQNAAKVDLAMANLALKSGAAAKFAGTVKRTAGFVGPVVVQVVNLPAGTNGANITVPAAQEAFELNVTPPAVTAAMDVPNVVLRVTSESGKPLQADVPLPTRIMP